MAKPISTYADALRYIYDFTDYERAKTRKRDDFRLDGIRALLAELGDPHEKLRNSVHITGSKGKGSVSAMLTSVLRSAGYSVGTYTSPHLNTHRERYRLNGEPVSERDFTELVRDTQPVIERVYSEQILSTFDIITALAFELFARKGVEWSVIEVGLGGRLDSTNVLTPALSVITSISLDHTETLGNSLTSIAREKSGIIKPGVPVVVNCREDDPRRVILEYAAARGSRALRAERLMKAENRQVSGTSFQEFTLKTSLCLGNEPLDGRRIRLNLLGEHQVENAITATVACTELVVAGANIGSEQMLEALTRVSWPGRFEIVEGEVPVVLDGAHNPEAIRRIRETMSETYPGARVACVFGTRIGHDGDEMLSLLSDYRLVLCPSSHPRTTPVEEIAALAGERGLDYRAAGSVREALNEARNMQDVDVVLVCGSLFIVADAREALGLATALDPVRS